jgi:putative transposase
MGRDRYKIADPTFPHFVTCTVLHWIPVFTRPATVEILLDSLRHLTAEGLKLYAYVILENHLHMVLQSGQLDRDIARFKSYMAKQLIHYLSEHNVNRILEQLDSVVIRWQPTERYSGFVQPPGTKRCSWHNVWQCLASA